MAKKLKQQKLDLDTYEPNNTSEGVPVDEFSQSLIDHLENPRQYPWRTPFNHRGQSDKEIYEKPSLTVPDQTLSISEILRRYASGLSLGGGRVPTYESEGEDFDQVVPDLRKMDLAEIQQIKEQNDAELMRIREEMVTKKKQLQELEKKNLIDNAVQAELRKREEQQKIKEDFDRRNGRSSDVS